MGAWDKPRSGVTHHWRAINTCSSSQTGMSPAPGLGNEVSFLLQQWEMEAELAGPTLGSMGTCWPQPGCDPSCSPVRPRQAGELLWFWGVQAGTGCNNYLLTLK